MYLRCHTSHERTPTWVNKFSPIQVHSQRVRFRVSTSLIPRAMTVVFGLGTRLHVCITRLENGVPRNGQQADSAMNSFFDKGKFEAMKTPSGCKSAHCDGHQFHAKIKLST